jgi:hypothetical protein
MFSANKPYAIIGVKKVLNTVNGPARYLMHSCEPNLIPVYKYPYGSTEYAVIEFHAREQIPL